MPTITILEKLYRSISPSMLEKRYSSLLKGLNVQVNYLGTTNRGWINLDVNGDDQTLALKLIDREFVLAPVSLEDYEKFSVLRGKILSLNRTNDKLFVDLGINSLKSIDAVLSKQTLSVQLADCKDISLKTLIQLFCLFKHMPIEIRTNEKFKQNRNAINATLSEMQIRLFKNWINDRFDRLIVLGSLLSDVNNAVRHSRISRDIIRIECLGLLEQSILCKLGTDAVGLIPKLGRYLKPALLNSFSPKRIIKEIGTQSLL
jgi:hypothetical protein